METQQDANVCDVQFSLRVTKKMAEDISDRAAAEGIKPASWIRKTLANALKDGSTAGASLSKTDLIRLIESEPEIQEALRKAVFKDLDKDFEKRAKRMKKEVETRLDDFEKMRKRQSKEIASMEKQIAALEHSIEKAEPEKVNLLINELEMKKTMLVSLRGSLAAVEKEILAIKSGGISSTDGDDDSEFADEPGELDFDDDAGFEDVSQKKQE